MTNNNWLSKPLVYTLVGLTFWTILDLRTVSKFSEDNYRRSLATTTNMSYLKSSDSTLLPWAHYNLRSVKERPDKSETALFWHIPKSGGTTAKQLYQCMGKTLTIRIGVDPRYGHDQSDELTVFKPIDGKDWKTVNVDTVSDEGILRAEEMGLVPSGKADIIFAMDVNFAASHLFDRLHKGRVLAIFRNPIDRLVSKFYYLQTATWERSYKPEWADMTILEWAEKHNTDENFLVKKIVGKKLTDEVGMTDLIIAKETIRRRFIVGLLDEMEESIHRFNVMLDVDEEDEKSKECLDDVFGNSDGEEDKSDEKEPLEAQTDGKDTNDTSLEINTNSNKHPKIVEGTPEYKLMAERNSLDMILYTYIRLLFEEQKVIINKYERQARVQKSQASEGLRNVQRKRQL